MAITTNTVSIAGTWTKVNLLEQLGEGLEWLGWHSVAGGGSSETGKVCGFQTFYGGGSLPNADPKQPEYQDVFPIATTGIGTGASFLVQRCPLDTDNGSGVRVIDAIMVNRPGYGYTGGEVVTLSAEDIGGSGNGATDITIPVVIESDITGGNSYICTFTGSNPINMEAYGRNGFVSGSCTNTYVEIQEGDTIGFDNNSSWSSLGLCWRNHPIQNTLFHEYTNENLVFNCPVFSSSGAVQNFTPISGQAGKYFLRESASDIRGYLNNDVGNVIVTPATSGISTVGFGTTNSWYHVDYSNTSYPWAIWRQSFDENKKFGATYRLFGINNSDTSIIQWVGSGWQPSIRSRYVYYSGGHGRGKRFAGANGLDMGYGGHIYETYATFEGGVNGNNVLQGHTNASLNHGGTTNKRLDLNIYRSGIDPTFAVFSYYEPEVSATRYDGRSFNAWFFHNFSQNVWDLDECFTSGTTFVGAGGMGGVNPYLRFSTQVGGSNRSGYDDHPSRRSGEFGYSSMDTNLDFNNYIQTDYYSEIVPPRSSSSQNPATEMRIYHRSTTVGLNQKDLSTGSGGTVGQDTMGIDYNPVIKGIPIQGKMVPCPYYLPDDFVLIDFYYGSNDEFIDQGDTITISGSEIYTVIVASYYQASGTTGIAFCARTT